MNIKKLCKNKKGFTLIEIIVVVVILAVLMAVAVPSVLKYMDEADNAKYTSQTRGAYIVMQTDLATKLTTDADRSLAADDIETVLEACEFTGTPKVTKVAIDLNSVTINSMPKVYYVVFDADHVGKLTENTNVEIIKESEIPRGVTVYTVSANQNP